MRSYESQIWTPRNGLHECLRSGQDVVMAAVSQCGRALQHASEEWRGFRGFLVLVAE